MDSFFSTARDLEIKGLINEKHSISKIEIPNLLPNEVQNEMEDEDSDDHNIAEYIKYRTKLIEDQTDLNAGPSSSKGPLHFLCGQCDSSFANKATLQHHINSTHLKIKFACEVCNNFETHKAAQLKKHKANEHGELNALFNCTHCNYKSAKASKLREHILNIHEEHAW